MGGAFCQRQSWAARIAASMTRLGVMAEKRTPDGSVPIACNSFTSGSVFRTSGGTRPRAAADASGLIFDALTLDVDALPDLTAIPGPGSEQFARLFRRLRFDAPLFDARDLHGRVISLELGLQLESGNSHGLLRIESPAKPSLALPRGKNKSATQIWPGTNALHSPAGTS